MNGNLVVLGSQTVEGKIIMTGEVVYEGVLKLESDLHMMDGATLLAGENKDGILVHDGTHTYFGLSNQSGTTGNLKIVRDYDLSDGSSVEVIDIARATSSVSVTGAVNVTGTSTLDAVITDGDVNFTGASYNALWDKSENTLHFNDNAEATFGGSSDSPDLNIYHNSSNNNSVIKHLNSNSNSALYIQSDKRIEITNEDASKLGLRFNNSNANHEVELFYDSESTPNARLTTKSYGIEVGTSVGTGDIKAWGDITAFYTSDERLKDNITPISDPLMKVMSISGNTFDWNENTTKEGSETGVIAQEIEKLGLPGVVTTRDDGYMAVRYDKLVPLLIEAIKQQNNLLQELKIEVNQLKGN